MIKFICKKCSKTLELMRATLEVVDGKVRTREALCECGEYMQEIEKEFTGFPTIHRKEPIHSASGLVRKANESIKRNEKK
mgnify:FL=1